MRPNHSQLILPGTSITANYNAGTGVLTLSGSDTVANYQQVLRTVTYNNTAQNLTTTARSITFLANDGTSNSNVGTTTVTMVSQDDAPVLDLDANDSAAGGANFATTFTEDGGAVGIADVDATLSDVDSVNFTSLTVTITNLLDGAAESLSANTAGTSITANYNSGTGILTLSGSDTVANYQQVLIVTNRYLQQHRPESDDNRKVDYIPGQRRHQQQQPGHDGSHHGGTRRRSRPRSRCQQQHRRRGRLCHIVQ